MECDTSTAQYITNGLLFLLLAHISKDNIVKVLAMLPVTYILFIVATRLWY